MVAVAAVLCGTVFLSTACQDSTSKFIPMIIRTKGVRITALTLFRT